MGDVAPPVGIVTGLQVEAQIARTVPGAIVACFGPGPDKAEQAARYVAGQGAKSLMSFGIAGGLDPALQAGDLVASPKTLAVVLKAAASTLVTVVDPAMTPEAKHALYISSGASAVDMETSAVSEVAQDCGLPFSMVRAICDEAADTIPRLALKAMQADGTVRPMRVATGLLTRPQDLSGLLALGQRQKVAMAALKRAVRDYAQYAQR